MKTHGQNLPIIEFFSRTVPGTFYVNRETIAYSGEGNGNSLQYSCLENPMNGGAW